jgi:hypothetical protein
VSVRDRPRSGSAEKTAVGFCAGKIQTKASLFSPAQPSPPHSHYPPPPPPGFQDCPPPPLMAKSAPCKTSSNNGFSPSAKTPTAPAS